MTKNKYIKHATNYRPNIACNTIVHILDFLSGLSIQV